MTSGLKRFHASGCTHFITFSCYGRRRLLDSRGPAETFESDLERVREWYGLRIYAYVVMPEHVHLLLSEPLRSRLSVAIQMLKQIVSRKLRPAESKRFWQPRYYDFLVKDEATRTEKLTYIHNNPVERGLCARPEDWPWSSFLHSATGHRGVVEIESEWTALAREKSGQPLVPGLHGAHPSPKTKGGERVGQP